jgi:hypothetical protein
MMNKWTTGALAGVAMSAFIADEAAARCDVTVTNVAANGTISVQRDVYIYDSRSSQWSGSFQYQADLTSAQSQGAAQLTEYFLNKNGRDGTARATSGVSHVTQQVVDRICAQAFGSVTIPQVRIPEPPVREVTPPPVREVTPPVRREVTPPARVYHAPTESLRPQARPTCGVQPVVVIEIPCDCDLISSQAAELERIIETNLGIEVSIYQDWSENGSNYMRVGVQDIGAQGGTINNNLTDANSDRFRSTAAGDLVSIEPGAEFQGIVAYLTEELGEIGYQMPTADAPAASAAHTARLCTPS